MHINIDVGSVLQEAEQFCAREGLAESTSIGRIGCLSRILTDISSFNPNEIKNWLENYISPRTRLQLGPHGKNAYIISIRWFLKRTTLVADAPEIMRQIKRYPTKSKGKCVSEDDLEAVLQFSPTLTYDLAYRLIDECGFRPHEPLSIRVCDVRTAGSGRMNEKEVHNSDEKGFEFPMTALVYLPESNPVTPSGKNKTGSRMVPVVKNAERLLTLTKEVERREGINGRLFPWGHKHLSVTFCRMKSQLKHEQQHENIQNAALANTIGKPQKKTENHEESGTDFRLYDLRHTAITDFYLTSLPDQVIRKIVGWTPSSRMPDVYVHVKEEHILRQLGEAYQTSVINAHRTLVNQKNNLSSKNIQPNKFYA
jgi:integrase